MFTHNNDSGIYTYKQYWILNPIQAKFTFVVTILNHKPLIKAKIYGLYK